MSKKKNSSKSKDRKSVFHFESEEIILDNSEKLYIEKAYITSILNDFSISKTTIKYKNSFKFISIKEILTIKEFNKPVLKKSNEIERTIEFQNLLNNGLSIYQNPKNLVKLSNENVNIIEDIIEHDDRYRFLFSKAVFDSFCKFNNKTNKLGFKRDRDSYIAVLRMIDIDNSTLIYLYKKEDFYRIIDFIMNDEEKFYSRLKKNEVSLVNDLVNQCHDNLLSFCSKVCKFLNQWMFDDYDGYYIYDYYVLTIASHYLDYYKNKFPSKYKELNIDKSFLNKKDYSCFHTILSHIHKLRNIEFKDTISKHHLDHIMWYSYRSFKRK